VNDSEAAAQEAEWQALEAALNAAGCQPALGQRLTDAMRSGVKLHRPNADRPFSATFDHPTLERLLEVTRAIPSRQRLNAIRRLSERNILRSILNGLHNRALLEQDIVGSRRLFGLSDLPSARLQESALTAAERLCANRATHELLARTAKEAPARIRAIASDRDQKLAAIQDDEALRFLDLTAGRIEAAARQLLPALREHLYIPDAKSPDRDPREASEMLDEAEQHQLRDFVHWLATVIHRFRGHCRGVVAQLRPQVGFVNVAAEYLEVTLFEAGFLLYLKRRYPDLFVETDRSDEADPSAGAEAGAATEPLEDVTRIVGGRYARFSALAEALDLLDEQWRRLPAERRAWRANANLEKSHEHLRGFAKALRFLRNLRTWADLHAPRLAAQTSVRRFGRLAGPAARHTMIVPSASQTDCWVCESAHVPARTNRAVQCVATEEDGRRFVAGVVTHHSRGQPCHGETCLLPLDVFFHPESRLVLAARELARECELALSEWETACLDCGLTPYFPRWQQRGIVQLHLVTYRPADAGPQAFFLFRDDELPPWLQRENLQELPADLEGELLRLKVVQGAARRWMLPCGDAG
jgi:hypothetical protein